MEVDAPARLTDLSEQGFLRAMLNLLAANDSLMITDLGTLLAKVLGPEASKVMKRDFKGLKSFLERHQELFLITGKVPTLKVRIKQQPFGKDYSSPLPPKPTVDVPLAAAKISSSVDAKQANVAFGKYLETLKGHLNKGEWRQVAKLARVRNSTLSASLASVMAGAVDDDLSLKSSYLKQLANSGLEDQEQVDWTQFVVSHLCAAIHYHNCNYKAAAYAQVEVTKCFSGYWPTIPAVVSDVKKSGSILDVWRVVVIETRQIARWADMSLESMGQEGVMLINAQNHLRGLGKTMEKNCAELLLQNQLLRIYSQNNTMSNFKIILQLMQHRAITSPPFPVSDLVTWGFFIGRYYLYQGDYAGAVPLLVQAFNRCSRQFTRNKQTILKYLLPAYAYVGTYPKKQLLEQYKLLEFYDILEGVRLGNYKRFNEALELHEATLDRGIHLPLTRLKTILFRNLFKKTAHVLGSLQEPPVTYPAKLPLAALHTALTVSGYDATPEETNCIVSHMISSKRLRGYISYEHKVIVLAKTGVFTPLKG